ncbi:hypothetical protein COJ48_08305 [Bacillus cereus]|nr:hypothetical protein COJ48_08305 [Bacillus cereus]PGP87398.1 hypothetical protein CN997_04380 [Bacillus cereus]
MELNTIFNIINEINKHYSNSLVNIETLKEEKDNLEDLKEIQQKMVEKLTEFDKLNLNSPENVSTFLVEVHLLLGDMEWQYQQLHEIIREITPKLVKMYDNDEE